MKEAKTRAETSPGWASLLALLGALYIADYFYQGRTSIGPVLSGLGFIALAPHAYLQPIRLRVPLSVQAKSREPVPRLVSWVATAGAVLLVAGAGVRWL